MKNKGFTLIELLAVIVVLAIIAVIAIPVVGNIVEKSRKEAFKDSVLSAFGSVEYYLVDNDLKDIPVSGIDVRSLKLKNNTFESGRLSKNTNGVLEVELISDGRYCANGTLNNLSISKGKCNISSPNIEINVNEKEVNFNITDEYGIVGYIITETEEEPKKWNDVDDLKSISETIVAEYAATYYIHAKNRYGKISTKQYIIPISAFKTAITYVVNDVEYIESVPNGTDILNPTTFEIVKNGYKFEGWSESADSEEVITSKVADGTPVKLYAVWSMQQYNNACSGTAYLNPNADKKYNYTAAAWIQGSTIVYGANQTITVSYSLNRQDDAIGGYLAIYLRNATTGARTHLGRVATAPGKAQEQGWGSGGGTTFKMPNDNVGYYIDYYGWGIGYYTGTHYINWTVNSTKIS